MDIGARVLRAACRTGPSGPWRAHGPIAGGMECALVGRMNLAISPLSFEATVGSYRVHRVIAEGDVATVHEAAHLVLPRRAAVKILRPEVNASPQAGQRLLREACVLEAFDHAGVVRVYDCGVLEDGRPWLAMELVGGAPLSASFARMGRLPVEQVGELLRGLVDVIAAAHRSGVVHRALAPSHVLVGGGGCHDVRVLGWGLSRQPGGAHDLAGDRRADVYAIGAMAYQAATGAPPYVAVPPVARVLSQFHARPTPVRTLRPDLAPELARLIDAMTDTAPHARPTAVDVAAELARLDGPYDDYQVLAEGTQPGRDPTAPPATRAAAPKSSADHDWDQLVALGAPRRPWSGARR